MLSNGLVIEILLLIEILNPQSTDRLYESMDTPNILYKVLGLLYSSGRGSKYFNRFSKEYVTQRRLNASVPAASPRLPWN